MSFFGVPPPDTQLLSDQRDAVACLKGTEKMLQTVCLHCWMGIRDAAELIWRRRQQRVSLCVALLASLFNSDYSLDFCQVLTAPHMEHGTQWAGRGQSSARMLSANLLPPASTHSPSSVFLPPFPPCISTTREKSTSIHPSLVLSWVPAGGEGVCFQSRYQRLTSSLPCCERKAGHSHRLRVGCLSTDTLSQTCITREALKASLWASAKKKGKWNNADNTSTAQRGGGGRKWGGRDRGGKKQNTRVHKCRKL